jgi:hypothetical protein
MVNPRDPLPQFNVPVDVLTGRVLTDGQRRRVIELVNAAEDFYEAMHGCEGSTAPGEHQPHTWQSRRMSIAATHVETALLFAIREALANP